MKNDLAKFTVIVGLLKDELANEAERCNSVLAELAVD